jgi:DNA-directed RNA polymerase sigma subunit (sigma70/sigma32)
MSKENDNRKPDAERRLAPVSLLGVMSRVFGVSVDKVTDSNDARKALVNAANDLRGREVMAVMLRAAGLTYRASGEVMGCTPERVRQIEAKGFRKLRHPTRIVLMQGYVRDDA